MTETDKNLLEFAGDKKYETIYADPPWRFQNRTGKVAPEHKRLSRYETMSLEERRTCIYGFRMPCCLTVLLSWMHGASSTREI